MNEKDPVCGMEVDCDTAAAQSEYQGETYYFCCSACKRQFDQNPERFVGKKKGTSSPV
jgi:YHS domain-containing protein